MSASQIDRRRIIEAAAQRVSAARSFDSDRLRERRFGPLFERAALMSSFSVKQIGGSNGSEETNKLLDVSRPVYEGRKQRWTLAPSVRKDVLKQLDTVEKIEAAMGSIRSGKGDPLLESISRILAGEISSDSEDLGELSTLLSVCELFPPETRGLPSADAVKRRIVQLNFLRPFRELAARNFKGRQEELRILSDYVGVLPAGSTYTVMTRAFRRVLNLREKPPLMLYGPGGMGKSTLIARFVLEHSRVMSEGRLPFTYIDFDRVKFTPPDPLTISNEALHQLETQYPDLGPTFTGLRRSWWAATEQATASLRAGSDAQLQQKRLIEELLPRMVEEFARALETVGLADRPYLLFLDTFEKARFRDPDHLRSFWRFVDSLQQAHPYLRLIVAGRAPVGGDPTELDQGAVGFDLKTEKLRLKGLPAHLAAEYLAEGGFPRDLAEVAAKRMTLDGDGVSPLTLRVAVAVWRQRTEQGADKALDAQFWADLQAGRIQDQLITRYLDHIEDKDVQRTAGAGLLLREVSAEIVREVLAPACGLDEMSETDALELFEKLRDSMDMFVSENDEAALICPRPEVRETLLELMRDLDETKVNAVHDQAIDYYVRRSDAADEDDRARLRAEEIYHRLIRGSDAATLRERWHSPEIAAFLGDVEWELDDAGRRLLRQLMGEEIPRGAVDAFSLAAWEAGALKRIEEESDPTRKLEILQEQEERTPGSRLYAIEASLLLELGKRKEAYALARRGLEELPDSATGAVRGELQVVAAKISHALGRDEEAHDLLRQARRMAVGREDSRRALEIALVDYEWALKDKRERDLDERRDSLIETAMQLPPEDVAAGTDLFARAIVALGSSEPTVILAGIRGGVLESVSHAGRRRLGRAMSGYDQAVSEAQNAERGLVARSVSIPLRGSLSDTWQALFVDLMSLVPVVLEETFSKFGLVHADPFLEQVVAELKEAQSEDEDAPRIQRAVKGWWSRAGNLLRLANIARVFARAFTIDDLRLLMFTLNRSLESTVGLSDSFDKVVFGLIQTANRQGWLGQLVVRAAELKPADGELLDIANELEVGVLRYRRKTLMRATEAWGELSAKLAALSRQLCLIEVEGGAGGTGMLVGPDLVLTAYAAVQREDGSIAQHAELIFDSVVDRGTAFRTRVFRGHPGKALDSSGYNDRGAVDADHLGYLLLQVDGHPGDEPVLDPGEGASEFGSVEALARRGWVDLKGDLAQPRVDQQLIVLYHLSGGQLFASFASRGITVVENKGPRIHYRGDTEPGAAGALCVGLDATLVALHQTTEGHRSVGTSMPAIVDSLRQHGALDAVGVALA